MYKMPSIEEVEKQEKNRKEFIAKEHAKSTDIMPVITKNARGKFQKGGGSGKRILKKSTRTRITKAYIRFLYDDFQKYGKEVIDVVRRDRPDVYLKLVAQFVPRDIDIKHSGDLRVQVVSFLDVKPEDLEKDVTPLKNTIEGVVEKEYV